jgi:O-antigen ligase
MSKIVFSLLWVLVFGIPLENMVVIDGMGTISRFVGIICMTTAILVVAIEKRGRPLGAVQAAFGLFLLWTMASFLWSVDVVNSQLTIVTMTQLFAFVWLIWEFSRDEHHQFALMYAYVCGAMISAFLTFRNFLLEERGYFSRYSTTGFDPNDLGLTLTLAIPMAWYLGMKAENFWTRQFFRLYLPISFLAIILTASRASLVAMLITYIFVLWSFVCLSKVQLFMVFGVLTAAVFGILEIIPDSSWERLSTFGYEMSSGRMGGRGGIWQDGLRIFSENPLIGIGAGSFKSGLLNHFGYTAASHNLFLSILVGQGLIGLLLFLLIIFFGIRGLTNMPILLRRMWIITLMAWVLGVMTLNWEGRKSTWLILGLLAVMGAVRTSEAEKASSLSVDSYERLSKSL